MSYKNIFKQVLYKYRLLAGFQRDKGDCFGHLMLAYLQTNTHYADQFTNTCNEFSPIYNFGSTDTEPGEYRVFTIVRCISEGVDVRSLNAVMFLSARNSQVDLVQSVGRMMQKSPSKKYGYIIIPLVSGQLSLEVIHRQPKHINTYI